MDDYHPLRFDMPRRSKEELYRQAHLYRRLAAATKNKARAMQLEQEARECELRAESVGSRPDQKDQSNSD